MIRSNKEYTVDALSGELLARGIITDRQRADIKNRERVLRETVLRQHARDAMVQRFGNYRVSPAEVIAGAALSASDGRALNEDRIMQQLAEVSGYPYVKLDPLNLNERLVTETMSRPFARRHACLPFKRDDDGKLLFAVDNPYDLELQESLRNLVPTGFGIVVSSKSDIMRIITDVYGFRSAIRGAERDISGSIDIGNLEQLVQLNHVQDIEANDKHIVNAVEYILHYAFDQRASDIHIEPKRVDAEIRLRIDGVLHTIYRMPKVVQKAVVSRLKVLARMDVAERRRPQAGRIKTERNGVETELRVSSLPVAFGEKFVIRIFDPGKLLQDVDELGFAPKELARYSEFLTAGSGMVLITGPTGSGKTTTLYSTLRKLATPDVNVTTIEDPIEMIYEPFNQSQVNAQVGMSFSEVLRTTLRQDPDIIMVGEIRDAETASMAVQAALTGHLVLSTLHTNDAPSAVTRMLDLGVPKFLISSVLLGVVAQRLVRKVCPNCRTKTTLSEDQAAVLGIPIPAGEEAALPVSYGEGCVTCRGTGLLDRDGVFEVMPFDAGIRALVNADADADALRREARANGMATLRESGIRKLALGVTSFEEVLRVLGS